MSNKQGNRLTKFAAFIALHFLVDENAIGFENKELYLSSFFSNKQGNRLTKFAAFIALHFLVDEKATGLENKELSLNSFLSNN